jgi:hypothetical protein
VPRAGIVSQAGVLSPFAKARPAGGGATAAGAGPVVGGAEVRADSGWARLTGVESALLLGEVLAAPGSAGPHRDPVREEMLGRRVTVHHLRSAHAMRGAPGPCPLQALGPNPRALGSDPRALSPGPLNLQEPNRPRLRGADGWGLPALRAAPFLPSPRSASRECGAARCAPGGVRARPSPWAGGGWVGGGQVVCVSNITGYRLAGQKVVEHSWSGP